MLIIETNGVHGTCVLMQVLVSCLHSHDQACTVHNTVNSMPFEFTMNSFQAQSLSEISLALFQL